MTELEEAVNDLREFVNDHFDGSTSRLLDLDELVWRVRLAHHHEPEMHHIETNLDDINLEDLGL